MAMARHDVKWDVLAEARAVLDEVRRDLPADGYEAYRCAFQDFLCSYFSSVVGCDRKLGRSISPMGKNASGGKCMKVRWLLPGGRKRGGLRVAIVAYCDEKRVKIANAWARKDEPSHEESAAAYAKAKSGAQ